MRGPSRLFVAGAVSAAVAGLAAFAAVTVFRPSPDTVRVDRSPTAASVPSSPAGPKVVVSAATPAAQRFVYPVGGCPATASRTHHDYPAADIFADVGCRFLAPVDGLIDEVNRTDVWNPRTNVGRDRGGLSVSLIGVDGVRYYGSHLSAVDAGIRPGVRVLAGQELGRTGRSGSARNTPAHLHFGISWPTPPGRWWIRRGAVPPQRFLDSWRTADPQSPAAAVARARAAYGADRGCRSYC